MPTPQPTPAPTPASTPKPSPLLMTHIVPFFPNEATSRAIAHVLLDEGSSYLEVQFAFSDPGADGPVIEDACHEALRQGFTVDKGFAFIRRLVEESPALKEGRAKIFLMTYASLPIARGIECFVEDAARAGVSGLIIPDLPLDSDEGLHGIAAAHNVHVIPVLALNSRPERIELVHNAQPEYIYCALRSGITGKKTELGKENIRFLDMAGARGAKILAGFGISEASQITALTGHAHAAVVGSALIRVLSGFSSRPAGELSGEMSAGKSQPQGIMPQSQPQPQDIIRNCVRMLLGKNT